MISHWENTSQYVALVEVENLALLIIPYIPIVYNHLNNSFEKPLPYKSVTGIENIDKIINIDQKPIGRTPRSNPATYTGFFTEIRNLFAATKEAKVRGICCW